MLHDLRIAARRLAASPSFSAIAVLTLALGLGATTAMFTVVNTVLLRPLPFEGADRIIWIRDQRLPQFPSFSVAPGHFVAWQARNTTFEYMAAISNQTLILTGAGEPERLRIDRATADLFPAIGASPLAGRFFTADDDRPGAEGVVVLSEAYWRGRLGADPSLRGRALTLSGRSYTVIGIAPASVRPILGDVQGWVPMAFDAKEADLHGSHYLRTVGRLEAGATLASAHADLNRIAEQLEQERPGDNDGWRVLTDPIHAFLVRNVRPALMVLSAAVALVMVVVSANVAGLLVARGLSRQRELAIRVALGAERTRLVREQVAEGLVLSGAACLAGLVIASGVLRGMTALAPDALPRMGMLGLDPAALAFAAALAAVLPAFFALLPALQAARTDPNSHLVAGRSPQSSLRAPARQALVVGQLALAMVLLVGCGLLVRSFVRLLQVSPGFNPSGTLTVAIQVPSQRYPNRASRQDFQRRLLEQLALVPGIAAAGFGHVLPLVADHSAALEFEGRPNPPPADRPSTNFYGVSPGFFEAMGIPLIRGRLIQDGDRDGRQRVAVINETFARLHYPNEDPIGRRVIVTQGPAEMREIVGIVGDTKQYGLQADTTVQVYESYQQHNFTGGEFVIRGAIDPASLTSAVRAAVRSIDRDQPIGRVATLQEVLDGSLAPQRFSLALFGTFAVVGIVLAAIGLYGLVAYTVRQRTVEIGVRLALGARRWDVLRQVVGQALVLSAVGIAIGLAVSAGATRLMRSLLYETSPTDPATFLIVPVVLFAAVIAASALPARRASRIDPAVALRGE
jgi:putative ABC transport system permease protein